MRIDVGLIALIVLIGILKLYSWYQIRCWSSRDYQEDCNWDKQNRKKFGSTNEKDKRR